ncbi:MAG TPA: HAMP domain-containing sensor histidine kinase [Oscillatoriaceae cyanobacterium]
MPARVLAWHRSLVFRVYLYAAVAFAVSLPVILGCLHMVEESHHRADIVRFVRPQLAFIQQDLERHMTGDRPSEQELTTLSRLLHERFRFVPWNERAALPASLGSDALLVDERPLDQDPQHWVRLDYDGKPVGAVEVLADRPSPVHEALLRLEKTDRPLAAELKQARALRQRQPFWRRGPLAFLFGPLLVPQLAWIWALLLLLVIVPPIALWVIRPLRGMVGVARRLGEGDLDTPVAVLRKDEFGELERAFEQMRCQLRDLLRQQAQLIEQKERLLTDVSHEIRAPLTRLMMLLPLLRQEGASGAMTDLFEAELAGAEELLRGVLTLARGGAPAAMRHERVDLAAIAERLVAMREPVAANRAIALAAELSTAVVQGDERQLEVAMRNLLDNALNYAGTGKHVRLVTGTDAQPFVRVEDDGPGIPAADLPNLFEPFYRPDTSRSRESGGAGLGLSIVKRIADSHGGSARLDSVEGQGTRVELRFPVAEAPVTAR